jgi:hypothetical protein
MDAPQSLPGTLIAGLSLVGVGALLGASAGVYAQKANGSSAEAAGASVGGMLGAMVLAFGSLVAGSVNEDWQPTGNMAALLAFGGMTAVAASAAIKPGGVFGPASSAPQVTT